MADAAAIIKARTYRVERFGNSCHPDAGLEAWWVQELMLLILKCKECKTEVVRAEVAKEFSRRVEDDTRGRGQLILGGN